MEMLSFDLVWLARPIEECLSGEGFIEAREAELRIDGPTPVTYAVWLGHCADDEQWYGLQEMLDEILSDEGWTIEDVDGFAINDSPVKTGIQPGWQREIIPWATFQKQTARIAAQATEQGPPPAFDQVRALEQRPTTWELGWQAVGWVGPSDEEARLMYAALVHDAAGHIRATTLHEGTPPDAETLDELVRRAAAQPSAPTTPIRPSTLYLADQAMANALADRMGTLAIRVEAHPTPQVQDALAQLTEHLSPDGPPPFLSDVADDTIQTFFDAAASFYSAAPWRRFEGHKYLGAHFDDGPWHYVNVMGQEEEAPGLAFFDDWLQLCRFHNNQPSFMQDMLSELFGEPLSLSSLEAAGAAEAMTLDTLTILHPIDAARVLELGINPLRDDLYALPYRYDAEEGLVAPHLSLTAYRALMEAILIALDRRCATPVTSIKTMLELDGHTVSLRYPADGTERPVEAPAGVRLVIEGRDQDPDPTALPDGLSLHVDAAGDAVFEDVARALRSYDEDFEYVGVGTGDAVLWDDRGRRKAPCPRMTDLTACDDLWVEFLFTAFPASVMPLKQPPDGIQIELVGT